MQILYIKMKYDINLHRWKWPVYIDQPNKCAGWVSLGTAMATNWFGYRFS